tara:strand:+ start:1236 stop:1355 length:120 start_codon:yes stop_codon:yes gene_type:complete
MCTLPANGEELCIVTENKLNEVINTLTFSSSGVAEIVGI